MDHQLFVDYGVVFQESVEVHILAFVLQVLVSGLAGSDGSLEGVLEHLPG